MQKALAAEGTKSQERALEEVQRVTSAVSLARSRLDIGKAQLGAGVADSAREGPRGDERPYVTGAKRRWRQKVAARMALREGN